MPENDCTIPLKRCAKCGQSKPATPEYFHRQAKQKDGLRTPCKECVKQPRKPNPRLKDGQRLCTKCNQWMPETLEFYSRQNDHGTMRFRAICRACGSAISSRWKKNNPEKHRQYNRKSYRANPDGWREYSRQWKHDNPERVRMHNHRRRAKSYRVDDALTLDDINVALEHFNGCCAVCERPLRDLFGTHTVAWDHWIALNKGGGNVITNIVPLCHGIGGCNNSKQDTAPLDWLTSKFGARKAKQILAKIEAYFEVVSTTAHQSN